MCPGARQTVSQPRLLLWTTATPSCFTKLSRPVLLCNSGWIPPGRDHFDWLASSREPRGTESPSDGKVSYLGLADRQRPGQLFHNNGNEAFSCDSRSMHSKGLGGLLLASLVSRGNGLGRQCTSPGFLILTRCARFAQAACPNYVSKPRSSPGAPQPPS